MRYDAGARNAVNALASLATPTRREGTRADGVLLAPAGETGGAGHDGPVDAVRCGPVLRLPLAGLPSCPVHLRVLTAQQTRCWLLSATLSGFTPADRLTDGTLRVLPDAVARDTSLATQYMLDLTGTVHWNEAVLLGVPEFDGDQLHVLVAFTDRYGKEPHTATRSEPPCG